MASSVEKLCSEIEYFSENPRSSSDTCSLSIRRKVDGAIMRRVLIEASDITFQTQEILKYSVHLLAVAFLDSNHFIDYEISFPILII